MSSFAFLALIIPVVVLARLNADVANWLDSESAFEYEQDAHILATRRKVSFTSRLKQMYPYYHTSSEINEEVDRLAKVCSAPMQVSTEEQDDVTITVVRIHDKQRGDAANRVFMVFGEHSREAISPESGLLLLRQLCGDAPMQDGQVREEVVADNDFVLVLNANPRSRAKFENGDFCLRTNPSGVDLNRNWDEKWSKTWTQMTNPGKEPFSEPETKILKRLLEEFRPTTFMSIHSGTRGMYMPWAYDTKHLAHKNQPAMLAILEAVDAKHCECPFGAAGREVGYSSPGTSLDYVYDRLNTPYSFAYEIYSGKSPNFGEAGPLKQRFEEQRGGKQSGESLLQVVSDLHAGSEISEQQDPGYCFNLFNPDSEERYRSTVGNWAAAYIETLSLVVKDLEKTSGPSKRIMNEQF